MDGVFYHDTKAPFITVPPVAVTLAATAKALYTTSQFPPLPAGYFNMVGKKLKICLRGIMTTGATPGNGSFNILYGTGADANGVLLMTGTPVALSINQTNVAWELEVVITCISIGNAGTLRCTGKAHFNNAVIASTLQPIMLPTTVDAVSGACDLATLATQIISVQYLRSGSTAETMQVIDMEVIAMN